MPIYEFECEGCGARVRSDESQRREREAARQDRIVESRKKRAAGESVRPAKKGAK